ncbi:hypothetical protein OG249_37770 [Streptomyces microflavus]|uniref:hypothetical protein n=1 Tax=Streptomyces microflavus TaxID=1919 RepID=UPI00225BE3BF|nr:hypothetical protein [Streptomyces microflavus]MCX4657609.1 hypothetical protein [Streptomyces microflavus]
MGRSRVCAVCGAGLPRAGSARRRYCSGACRAQAYRDRQTSGRIIAIGVLTAEATATGDTEALERLLCPVCRQPVLPGGRRRRDARYCSGTCRTRAWRHRRLPREEPEEPVRATVTSTRHRKARGAAR